MVTEADRDETFSEVLNRTNSLAWFLIDAAWMSHMQVLAVILVVPTIVSGIWLMSRDRNWSEFTFHLGVNAWIVFDATWLLSESGIDQRAKPIPYALLLPTALLYAGAIWFAIPGSHKASRPHPQAGNA